VNAPPFKLSVRSSAQGELRSLGGLSPSRDLSVRHSGTRFVPHLFDSCVNPFDLLGAVKSCSAGHYAAFRGSIARTLDAVSTARYERTLAPSSSLDNS